MSTETFVQWMKGRPLAAHESAAVLVQLAIDGERSIRPYECNRERDCFYLRRKYQPEIRLAAWTLLILQIFDRPRWTYYHDEWNNGASYPSMGIPTLRDEIMLPLYLIMLCVIGWAVILEAGYEIIGMSGGVHDKPGGYFLFGFPIKDGRGRKTPRLLFYFTVMVWVIAFTQVLVALFSLIGGYGGRPFWVSPTLSLFVILGERSSSRRFSYLLRILPNYMMLLCILMALIALFTGVGFIVFDNDAGTKEYFPNFETGLWTMMMALVGSNWPGPIIPSVMDNYWYFYFWFLYLLVVCWGFLNVLLGLLFSFLTEQRDRSERLSVIDFRSNMFQAFSILDEDHENYVSLDKMKLVLSEIRAKYLDVDRLVVVSPLLAFLRLLVKRLTDSSSFIETREKYVETFNPVNNKENVITAFNIAPAENNFSNDNIANGNHVNTNGAFVPRNESRIFSNHFTHYSTSVMFEMVLLYDSTFTDSEMDTLLNNLWQSHEINLNKTLNESKNLPQGVNLQLFYEFPSKCLTKESLKAIHQCRREFLKRRTSVNRSASEPTSDAKRRILSLIDKADSKQFDAIMDLVFFLFSFVYLSSSVHTFSYVIFALCVVESILRLQSKGKKRFVDSYRNIMDMILTILLFFAEITAEVENAETGHLYITSILIFRMLLFPRNLTLIKKVDDKRKRMKLALKHLGNGAQDVLYLLLVLFCVACAFCELGIMVFGGLIKKTGSEGVDIYNSAYGSGGYWPLNFNDFSSGLVTLFTLLHVNNMHITCSGFEATMYSYQPRVFFVAWYFVGVLLLLNVIPAFLLSNFWNYYVESVTGKENLPVHQHRKIMETLEETDVANDSIWNDLVLNELKTNGKTSTYQAPHVDWNDAQQDDSKTLKSPDTSFYKSTKILSNIGDTFLKEVVDVSFAEVPMNNTELSPKSDELLSESNNKWTPFQWIYERMAKIQTKGLSRIQIAAILVDHAREGLPPMLFSSETAYVCYKLRAKFGWIFRLASFLLVFLQCFSTPSWTENNSDWKDDNIYPMSRILYLSNTTTFIFSEILLFIILLGLCIEFRYHIDEIEVKEVDEAVQYVTNIETVPPDNDILWPATDEQRGIDRSSTSNMELPLIPDDSTCTKHSFFDSSPFYAVLCCNIEYVSLLYRRFIQFLLKHLFSVWKLRLFLVFLCICIMIVVALSTLQSISYNPFIVAIASVVWFDPYTFKKFQIISFVLPRFLQMIALLSLLVLGFSIFADSVYQFDNYNNNANRKYFGTFEDCIWTIFLVITSTSFPNQILPTYSERRDSITFFFVVITVGSFIFLDLILLLVYAEFEKGMKIYDSLETSFRNINLKIAFEILDKGDRRYLTFEEIELLLIELYTNFGSFRKHGVPTDTKRKLLVSAMDFTGSGYINLQEFHTITDITRIKLHKKRKKHFLEELKLNVTQTNWFKSLSTFVNSPFLSVTVDVVVLICVCLEFIESGSIYSTSRSFARKSLGVLASVLVQESILKFVVLGEIYFSSPMNKYVCFVALVLVFTLLMEAIFPSIGLLRFARVVAILRLCAALRSVDLLLPKLKLNDLATKAYVVSIRVRSLAVAFFCVTLFFTSVGVYLFGGAINKNPSDPDYQNILNSRYGQQNYWVLNFNDIPSGFMTLICILHISDWDVITEGISVASSNYSRIFFSLWYCVGVLLLLNIVKAFFMRGFVYRIINESSPVSGKSSHENFDNLTVSSINEDEIRKLDEMKLYVCGNEPFIPYVASLNRIKFLNNVERALLVSRLEKMFKEESS